MEELSLGGHLRLSGRAVPAAGEATVSLDLHGKNAYQARVALDAALRRSAGVYRIRVIHGYHGGTALRELVRGEYGKHPAVLRMVIVSDSVTDLVLREL